MPVLTIQSPDGRSFKIEAPEGATDEQVLRFAKSQGLFDEPQDTSIISKVGQALSDAPSNQLGLVENALSLASSAALQPVAGIAGLVQAANPWAEQGAGAEAVRTVQGMAYQPQTEAGQRQQQGMAEAAKVATGVVNKHVLAPNIAGLPFVEKPKELFEAVEEKGMRAVGEGVLESTGSPLLATLAETFPELSTTIIGGRATLSKQISNRKAITAKISKAIKEGDINAGNIAKTLDKNGALINNPRLKEAIKLMGDDDAAYSAAINFEKMNNATKLQINKILDVIQDNKNSLDPSQIMENRPVNVIGESLGARLLKLDDIKKKASAKVGDIIKGDVGKKTVDTSLARDKLFKALSDADIDIARTDSGLVVDTSRTLTNVDEVINQKRLNNLVNRLASGQMKAADAHKLKRSIRELVDYDGSPMAAKVSKEIENALGDVTAELNQSINKISKPYELANKHFSESIDALKAADKKLGKNLMIGDELASSKLGDLSKRIGTNLASRQDTIKLIDSIDEALGKRGIRPKDDIKRQVSALADLEKIFKIESAQAPFGIKARFEQGVADAATGGAGTGAIKQVVDFGLDKFREMKEPDFNARMKALRALSRAKDE